MSVYGFKRATVQFITYMGVLYLHNDIFLSPVYTIQPLVKPVIKPVWQPVVSYVL